MIHLLWTTRLHLETNGSGSDGRSTSTSRQPYRLSKHTPSTHPFLQCSTAPDPAAANATPAGQIVVYLVQDFSFWFRVEECRVWESGAAVMFFGTSFAAKLRKSDPDKSSRQSRMQLRSFRTWMFRD